MYSSLEAPGSCDETRLCIRALVTVIRQAQGGSSPVDSGQLAHMRKVVRLLSLSEEQIAEMPADEREAVTSIRYARTVHRHVSYFTRGVFLLFSLASYRRGAIQKMKLATSVHGAVGVPPGPMGSNSASPQLVDSVSGSSPGSPLPVPASPAGARPVSTSAPPPYGTRDADEGSMAPPAFYTRKTSAS